MVPPPRHVPVDEDEEMDEEDEPAAKKAKDLGLEFPKSKFNRNYTCAQGRRRQLHMPIKKSFTKYLYMPT